MAGRTFEKFFLDFMAETIGETIQMTITDEAISISIDDYYQKNQWEAEARFIVNCKYSSKGMADKIMDRVRRAIKELPMAQPLVQWAMQEAQDVSQDGGPRKFIYTGAFAVGFHDEESY